MMQKLQEKVLGFDPYSKERRSFIINLTPEQAQYILNYHNGDNRKLTKSQVNACLLYTSPSPRDRTRSRMPSSA